MKGGRVVEERVALGELSAEPLDARELGEHLGAACVGRFRSELCPKPLLGAVEVVEVPERSQTVCHRRTLSRPRGHTSPAVDIDVDVTPPMGRSEREALLAALERTRMPASSGGHIGRSTSWRRAGIREAVGDEETDGGYSLSPRSTRGATRA